MGFLALATQLDHVLLGPQRLMRASGTAADGKSLWIDSDRTTFARPFRRDRVDYDGGSRMKTFLSPVGLVREKPLHLYPLDGVRDRKVVRFNGFELYPTDAEGRILVRVNGEVKGVRPEGSSRIIAGVRVYDAPIGRRADGSLRGTLEASDGTPRSYVTVPGRLRDRIRDFVRHPVFIVNPRLIVTLIVSGAFDTAWYYLGKDVGRREAEYRAGLAPKPKNVGERRVLATTLLPLPIATPTSPAHILEQTAIDAGLASAPTADAATQALLARSLPMPGDMRQFVAGLRAGAAAVNQQGNG